MKRSVSTLHIVLVVIVAIITVFWGPILWVRHYLLKKVDHHAVATACLDLLTKAEYQALAGRHSSGGDPRLPASIREINPVWVDVQTNKVRVYKMSTFHGLGFVFRPSASDTNRYDLVLVEEQLEYDTPLASVRKE